MGKTLILGYGNTDRQDDGVAWHVLNFIAQLLGRPVSISPDEDEDQLSGSDPELRFVLQLTPEMAESIAPFERVCFVDAHTGAVAGEVNLSPLEGRFQSSPFTHHLTPDSCLALAEALYGRRPQAILVSVRGYEFGFERVLSPRTKELADQAARQIYEWLGNPPSWNTGQ